MSPTRPTVVAWAATLALLATLALRAADEPLDPKKVRQLRQKVVSGEKLTPDEQADYERAKAARQAGEPAGKKRPDTATVTSTNTPASIARPLTDMTAADRYRGEDGGLYGGGRNAPPEAHHQAALAVAAQIQPLDLKGQPSSQGKIVLLTHGMSNTTMDSQAFLELANAEPRKNPALVLIDGAQGGIDARDWVEDAHTRRDESPWGRLDQRLKTAGVTPLQVQVVWMKHAIAMKNDGRVRQFGQFPKYAQQLKEDMAQILRMLKQRFPNLQLAYLSSRSYGGYATTPLNPEPYAYEGAFAVRWLIQDQIKGADSLSYAAGKAPLLLWGPYLWADGEKGRQSDDLIYQREDYGEDGTHPTESGRLKVAKQLVKFFTTDPTAKGWFTKQP